jgi:hypothetical protein
VLTAQAVIKLKLRYYRVTYNLQKPAYNIIYENITWEQMDKNILCYLKYLVNYCFFKFGLEVALSLIVALHSPTY